MVGKSTVLISPAATISPFPKSTSLRHGVDVARQAAAGFGASAALEVQEWLSNQTA